MKLVAVALALASAMAFAGCVGGGASGGDDGDEAASAALAETLGEGGGGDGAGATGGAAPNLVTFDLAEPLRSATWANGTWKAQEAWTANDALPSPYMHTGNPASLRSLDISSLLPSGLPVVVSAEMNADLAQGDMDLWLQAPFQEIWTYVADAPYGGFSTLEALVVHASSDPVTINLFYDVLEPAAEFPYTLVVRVEYVPDLLPDGLPVGVDVAEPGTAIRLERATPAASGAQPAALLFSPRDEFLGRFPFSGDALDLPIAADAEAGEYVLVLADGSGAARVSLTNATAPPAPFRVMTQEIVSGAPQAVGPGVGATSAWSYEADRMPLQTGLFFTSGELAVDVAATLTGPEGPLLGLTVTGPCPFCGWNINTRVGGDGLAPGTYQAAVEMGQSVQANPRVLNHWLVYYARS